MAGPDLPEDLVAGATGHIADHNAAHDVVNRFDVTETPAVGEVPTWDGTVYAPAPPPGSSGSAGFDTAFGHRYVDYINGSDSDNGISPATAKKTLQAAHDSLPTGGGIVWAAPGIHQIATGVNWTRNASMLIGAGRNATAFRMMANGITGIKITGDYVTMSDFKIGDESGSGSGINALNSIWVNDTEWVHLTRIRFDQCGKGLSSGLNFAAGSAGLRIVPTSQFHDWGLIDHCEFRSNYRSIAIGPACNGWISHIASFGNVMEHVKIWKYSTGGIGESCEWFFDHCWFVGAPNSTFQVNIDKDPALSSAQGNYGFEACVHEFSAAGTGYGGIYTNLSDVVINSALFTVTGASGPMVRTGPLASDCIVGPYRQVGGTAEFEVDSDATTAMKLWQPSDFTGTPTTV